MHYFEVVLCTLLVPSKNSRGIFIEISWKSLGSNLSGPLAGPLEKQSKSKKIKGKSMVPGCPKSPKPPRPLEILEKINKFY